ncbi:hypothetical protein [uncultured Campylobacter sp.]|uniref:hypothetical protein n=1 Tax=uncultured Campylobacter sp. TaxID=218934 RepID=UPI002622074B|nr:hypothetical protein [uncultured Campylobacter sp.]
MAGKFNLDPQKIVDKEAFKFDMVREMREFYKLFLDLELTDEQIYKILGRGAE